MQHTHGLRRASEGAQAKYMPMYIDTIDEDKDGEKWKAHARPASQTHISITLAFSMHLWPGPTQYYASQPYQLYKAIYIYTHMSLYLHMYSVHIRELLYLLIDS